MASSGVRFRFDADGNAQSYVDGLTSKMQNLNNTVKGELTSKLASLFKITAIEESVRRTAQWADELRVAAAEIGVNTDELQTLSIAGDRVGVTQDKLITFYDKLETAIIGAQDGQRNFIRGFSELGISLDDNKTKAEIFNEILEKAGSGNHDAALKDIFGKQYNSISRLGKEVGPGGLDQYGKDHAEQILPKDDVNSLANNYHQIITDFKAIGTMLAPAAVFILAVVDGLVQMIKGIVFAITDLFKGIPGLFTHPLTTIGHALANVALIGEGLIKMGANVLNIISFGHLAKGNATLFDQTNKTLGIGGDRSSNYQQVGNAVGAVLGGEALSPLSKIPIAVTKQAIIKGIVKTVNKTDLAEYASLGKLDTEADKEAGLNLVVPKRFAVAKYVSKASAAAYKNAGALFASAIGGVNNNPADFSPPVDNSTLGDLRKSGGKFGGFGAAYGSNSNLSIGGTSGVDVGARLVDLANQQVQLLTMIAENTSQTTSTTSTQSNNGFP